VAEHATGSLADLDLVRAAAGGEPRRRLTNRLRSRRAHCDGEPVSDGATPPTLPGALLKAGGWLVSGVGVAAAVAALGGLALFTRFYTAHIPAAEALTVVPEAELVVRGTMSLAFYLVLGGTAVAVVALVDPRGEVSRGTIIGLLGVVVAEMAVPVWTAADVPLGVQIAISAGLLAAWVLGALLLPRLDKAPSPDARGRRKIREWLKTNDRWLAVGLLAGELAVVLVICVFYLELGLTLLLAGLLMGALLRVAKLTGRKFAPYGVAVFLSVMFFGAGATALRALQEPQARPVAALLKDDARGVCGLYVTETNDRLFVAQVELDGERPARKTGRIVAIPKSGVIAESVGDLQKVAHAYERAREMRDGLIAAQPPATAAQEAVVTTTTRKTPDGNVEQEVTGKRPAPAAAGGTAGATKPSPNGERLPCAKVHVTESPS
jgi:hypothetical protein